MNEIPDEWELHDVKVSTGKIVCTYLMADGDTLARIYYEVADHG